MAQPDDMINLGEFTKSFNMTIKKGATPTHEQLMIGLMLRIAEASEKQIAIITQDRDHWRNEHNRLRERYRNSLYNKRKQ